MESNGKSFLLTNIKNSLLFLLTMNFMIYIIQFVNLIFIGLTINNIQGEIMIEQPNFYRLKMLIIVALFSGLIGVLAQISIPLPFNLVPITGQTLAIGLAGTIIGSKHSTYATILYVIMGAIGIPVFSNFKAGLSAILSPTGGFIIGFIPTAFVIGYIIERFSLKVSIAFIANVIGMLITLFFGTVWYKFSMTVEWGVAFASTFYPFLLVGIIKAYMAANLGVLIRKRLLQAKLIFHAQ